MKNRITVIYETAAQYESMKESCDKLIKDYAKVLRINPSEKSCEELKSEIIKWIEKKKANNLEVTEFNDDPILSAILDIFDGKVGEKFDTSELESIKKEGKERFDKQIPPGYKDSKKLKGEIDNNAL